MSYLIAYASNFGIAREEPRITGNEQLRVSNKAPSVRVDLARMETALASPTVIIPQGLSDDELDAFIIAAAKTAR